MKKFFGFCFASCLVGLLFCSCNQKSQQAKPSSTSQLWQSQEWSSQQIWSSQNLQGQLSLVFFWATWCTSCQEEIPSLIQLQSELSSKGLKIYSVNLDENPDQVLPNYLKRRPFPFPILLPSQSMDHSIGIPSSMPTLMLFNTNGEIVQKWVGLQSPRLLRTEIEAFLQ